jgi:hypothetical protein
MEKRKTEKGAVGETQNNGYVTDRNNTTSKLIMFLSTEVQKRLVGRFKFNLKSVLRLLAESKKRRRKHPYPLFLSSEI